MYIGLLCSAPFAPFAVPILVGTSVKVPVFICLFFAVQQIDVDLHIMLAESLLLGCHAGKESASILISMYMRIESLRLSGLIEIGYPLLV